MKIINNKAEKLVPPESEVKKSVFDVSNFVSAVVLLSFCTETIRLKITNFLTSIEGNVSLNATNPTLTPTLNDHHRLKHLHRSSKEKDENHSVSDSNITKNKSN